MIDKALKDLSENKVIGLPTETVYGLAASINSREAIELIFKLKERPFFDPLIVHIANTDQAKSCALSWDPIFIKLADKFWPGPLTLIVPKAKHISDLITSGLDTVGLRMPNHPLTLELITQFGTPLAAPSANKFKKTSPTCAEHVQDTFKDIHILDGGPSDIGIESTIVGFENGELVIYRPGMITAAQIEACVGKKVTIKESPVAPGHLKHHYMPETPIILSLESEWSKEHSLIPKEFLKNIVTWSLPCDAPSAARQLYGKLRSLDKAGASSIVITYSERQKLNSDFSGIMNRLEKAASFHLS